MVFKQDIGIPMSIDPAPFWANLFLYFFKSKHVQNLISKKSTRAYKYHANSRFIDDLYAINDGDVFSKSFKCIYPVELELKLKHSGTHATSLDLDIKIQNGIFVYRPFHKRDKFPFFIVRIPHFESNIPSTIFYGSIFSEILRIVTCTLKLEQVVPVASELYSTMLLQGANQSCINKQIVKGFQRSAEVLKKHGKNYSKILQELKNYLSSK